MRLWQAGTAALAFSVMLERLIERASPALKTAMSYWLSLKPCAAAALDPMHISHLLPRVALCEIEPQPSIVRTKIRLAGDVIRERAGRRVTGCYVDEAYPCRTGDMDRILQLVASGNVAWRRGPSMSNALRRYRYSEVVMLPFSSDGVVVDHAIWVVEVHQGPRRDEFLYEPGRSYEI
jgi:hypothetical protein